MSTVKSKDGTTIAYTRIGQGPALIFVDGALCHREFGPSKSLCELLAKDFTVFSYDRRGRGESGNSKPYAVAREVEDLAALINAAGGTAFLAGVSSGAALALEAANSGLSVQRLALYEPPFIVDNTRTPTPDDFIEQLNECLAAGRPGDAVKLFMRLVQVPGFFIAFMRLMPAWTKLKAVAHTLPYDLAIVIDRERGKPLPPGSWSNIRVPTLLVDGSKSKAWMRNGVRAAADAIPTAQYRTLKDQTHMVKARVLVPVLTVFLLGS
jgi:pimeloyl-ACP methyl ester carboxylesterase